MSAIGSSVFLRGGCALLLLIVVHCGARTANVCLIPAGTYVTHFSQKGPAVRCPNVPDHIVIIDGDGAIAGGSDPADGGWPHNEVGVDSSTCTSTLITDTGAGPSGIRTIVFTAITLHAGSVSGMETIDTTNPMAYPKCPYDITLTKSGK
jgi:hypothetical protein